VGLDVDSAKIEALNAGQSYIKHIDGAAVAREVDRKAFSASTDFARIRDVQAVIICVPTPLSKNREPDISTSWRRGRRWRRICKRGLWSRWNRRLIPGRRMRISARCSKEGSGLKAGTDFHLAFSPEREDPAKPEQRGRDNPKVVGGYTPACLEKAVALYSIAIKTVVPVSSCRVAEATKLLENIFRSVNIALVNELKRVYAAMDIDIWEVVDAAKTKPFGFMAFYPGPGLGGHCIRSIRFI
jgi:UDP-N-acetyl-D-glucosamine dehydrogenase